jgi:RNA recognition motif-containing protein
MYNKVKNRGLAFITMSSEEEALAALNSLNKTVSILLHCKNLIYAIRNLLPFFFAFLPNFMLLVKDMSTAKLDNCINKYYTKRSIIVVFSNNNNDLEKLIPSCLYSLKVSFITRKISNLVQLKAYNSLGILLYTYCFTLWKRE